MKRLVVILVAALYLLGLTQLSVSFHHCGKELKYVTFNNSEEKVCCGKKGNKKHCCCIDQEVKYSIDDQILAKKETIAVKIFQQAVQQYASYSSATFCYKDADVIKITHPPPLYGELRAHIINCVFLI